MYHVWLLWRKYHARVRTSAWRCTVQVRNGIDAVVPQYTRELLKEFMRTRQSIRGRNGTAEQSGLPVARWEEIIKGDPVTDKEHKMIVRAFPKMKHYERLLLEWAKPQP